MLWLLLNYFEKETALKKVIELSQIKQGKCLPLF